MARNIYDKSLVTNYNFNKLMNIQFNNHQTKDIFQ